MADVEKVARALCRHDNVGYMGGDFLEDIIDKEWPRYIPQARAALAAMGEWEAVGEASVRPQFLATEDGEFNGNTHASPRPDGRRKSRDCCRQG